MATRELTLEEQLLRFVERWKNYQGTEQQGAQPFLTQLLECYGVTEHAPGTIFEQRPGAQGASNGALFLDTPKPRAKSLGIVLQRMDMYLPKLCVWEMKGPREDLSRHHGQILAYWSRTRPRYMVLCNFSEFWIYDTDEEGGQLQPKLRFALAGLPAKAEALLFLRGDEAHFAQRGARITKLAAQNVGRVLAEMLDQSKQRDLDRPRFTKFVLECVFAKFAEDTGILLSRPFTAALKQAQASGDPAAVFNLFDDFARKLDAERSQSVPYINGPLYDRDHPKFAIARKLLSDLILAIHGDKTTPIDWQDVRPEVFGSIFERSLHGDERQAAGAHFTSELDIMKVVGPTVVKPWRERIDATRTHKDCDALIERMKRYHVLDPACGSGNFLYVAYREMKRLEKDLRERWLRLYREKAKRKALDAVPPPPAGPYFSIRQLCGIDKLTEAVQLTQVVLWIGQHLADRELVLGESTLPLTPLTENIIEADALFMDWRGLVEASVARAPSPVAENEGAGNGGADAPPADFATGEGARATKTARPTEEPGIELAIIGNPPFMGRHRMRQALSDEYVDKLHKRFPHNRNADLVTYWYPRAIATLHDGERAGFVSTNSIAQNESREASIDRILAAGGTLHDCWKSYPWPGEAAVHVSIVNWVMGKYEGACVLDGERVESISSGLSSSAELSGVSRLKGNLGICFEGVQPGNDGFIISKEIQSKIVQMEPKCSEVIKPLLIAQDVARNVNQEPSRFAIDFNTADQASAKNYFAAFAHLQDYVYPVRTRDEERKPDSLKAKWWQFKRTAPDMRAAISGMTHYLAIPRVSPHVLVARVPISVLPDSRLKVIALNSWYHFAILQSAVHEYWAWARGATLEDRLSYTNTTVFETYPFPALPGGKYDPRIVPKGKEATALAKAGQAFYEKRAAACIAMNVGLTKVHNFIKGKTPLTDLKEADQTRLTELQHLFESMNNAVCACYGWPEDAWRNEGDVLGKLLNINANLYLNQAE